MQNGTEHSATATAAAAGRQGETCRAHPLQPFVVKIFIHIYQTQGLGRQRAQAAWHNTVPGRREGECAPAWFGESNYSCPGWGCRAQLCPPLGGCCRTRAGKPLPTAGNSGGSTLPPRDGASMGLLPHLQMGHLQLPKGSPQAKPPLLRACNVMEGAGSPIPATAGHTRREELAPLPGS